MGSTKNMNLLIKESTLFSVGIAQCFWFPIRRYLSQLARGGSVGRVPENSLPSLPPLNRAGTLFSPLTLDAPETKRLYQEPQNIYALILMKCNCKFVSPYPALLKSFQGAYYVKEGVYQTQKIYRELFKLLLDNQVVIFSKMYSGSTRIIISMYPSLYKGSIASVKNSRYNLLENMVGLNISLTFVFSCYIAF